MRAITPRFFLVFLAAVNVTMLLGCASTDSLNQAITVNRFNEAISWVEKGADVNELDALGNTPLCNIGSANALGSFMELTGGSIHNERKASNEEIELATLLIKKGAKVNAKCHVSNTPLHYAALNGFTEIANLLIVNGAKLNVLNDNGNTPLMMAYSRGHTETANLLVNNGANASLKNRQGNSAKDLYSVRREKIERAEEAKREQERREKAESRAFWKGAATVGTGIAVGNATRGYSPDQQTRMMKSSMNAVDSGDTSELTETTNQVKAEQAQSHKAKMQAIEAQKERDRAAAQRAQEDERNNQAQRRHQQSQAQPRNSPSLAVVSNSGGSRNSSNQQVGSTPKQSTVEIKTITVESDVGGTCHTRESSETLARKGVENKAHDLCYELGKGWSFDKERFGGYAGCTPCTGGESGNYRCKITKAMYDCKHR